MKKYILILMILFSAKASADEKQLNSVNMTEINMAVTDSAKATFYPRLLKRFAAGDLSLTMKEFRMIYYGAAFEKGYDGYHKSQSEGIRQLVEQEKFKDALAKCDSMLKELPASLTLRGLRPYIMMRAGYSEEEQSKANKMYFGILDAVFTSGDGTDCPSAIKIMYIDDEYDLMSKILNIKNIEGQSLVSMCDRFDITPSDTYPRPSIFFDISELLVAKMKQIESK